MPDESCRICGGTLVNCSVCSECRKVTQRICSSCGLKTENQLHGNCFYLESHQTRNKKVTSTVSINKHRDKIYTIKHVKKEHPLRNALLIFGIIGFFVLGFSSIVYFDPFPTETQTKIVTLANPQAASPTKVLYKQFENCLGYGTGQTMTVKCPTELGYVYEAVMHMPSNLSSKLSSEVFFIRGISLNENPDGTVILQYQKNSYNTNLLGS